MATATSSTESRIAKLKEENKRLKKALAILTDGGTGDGEGIDAAAIMGMSPQQIAAFGPERALDIINRDRESNQ
jgi:hypothetical protein